MKKLLFLAVLIGVGFASCKKEESATPKASIQKSESFNNTSNSNLEEKRDVGSWD